MASWSRDKVDSSNINGGNEYTKGSRVSRQHLNAMVNSGLYSQDFAEHLADTPDTTNAGNVGTPSVSFVDNIVGGKTYKKFKFENLKGATGATGATPNISANATTLPAGSSATVSVTGTTENPVLNFGIPKGADGEGGITFVEKDVTLTIFVGTTPSQINKVFDSVNAKFRGINFGNKYVGNVYYSGSPSSQATNVLTVDITGAEDIYITGGVSWSYVDNNSTVYYKNAIPHNTSSNKFVFSQSFTIGMGWDTQVSIPIAFTFTGVYVSLQKEIKNVKSNFN